VGALPGVTLLDMDDLRSFAAAGATAREGEVAGVRTIIDDELERYLVASSAREVAPMIVALRDRAETVRQAEIERYRTRLGELEPDQLAAIEALTHGIIGKLLHDPQLALKDAAGSPRGDRLVAALRDLFALDDE
jgi:glutamyl-tRNA reductase